MVQAPVLPGQVSVPFEKTSQNVQQPSQFECSAGNFMYEMKIWQLQVTGKFLKNKNGVLYFFLDLSVISAKI